MAIMKYDKVVLTKEFDSLKTVGKAYEIANIVLDKYIIRDVKTKAAVAAVNIEELDKYFEKVEELKKKWTPWTGFVDKHGNTAFYRTNYRKVEVKAEGYKSTATCNLLEDEFNLFFGIQVAYHRCLIKSLKKQKEEYEKRVKELNEVEGELKDNTVLLRKMIASLYNKGVE